MQQICYIPWYYLTGPSKNSVINKLQYILKSVILVQFSLTYVIGN
jgi:hypothetical protein